MILHDPAFETLANAPVKQTDVIVARQILDVSGYIDDTTMVWSSSSILMEAKIDAVGQMLGVATKKAVVKLLGIVNGVNVGETFQIRLGLYNNDPSATGFDYLSEGFFLVETIDYDYEAGSTTVTLYDHMWRAGKLVYSSVVGTDTIDYPITVEDFATHIATLLNVDLMTGFASLPNSQYNIAVDLYSSISRATIQNVIQDIAGATGTTARISDTTLVFSQYSVSSENLDSDNLKTLKIGDTYGPITSVVLGRQPQNDNIALYAANPTNYTVTSVNTGTDVLTITDSGMVTGNMVYFSSTGTLPAPLVAGQRYYTYMVSGDDTFKLSDTYAHAIAGTNFINITSAGTGTISIAPIVTKEIQINNDEILDDEREILLPALYNTLSGIDWTEVKADTVGLGWHEVGDVIQFTQGPKTVRGFINEIHLTLAGSVKENLVSTIPDLAAIDYQAAGGIVKTIYNTEIKVDKQAQDITSIVSEQQTFEGQTTENFSEIYQNLTEILLTLQNAGGGNLIQNSVGFATEPQQDLNLYKYDGLLFWNYPDPYQQIVDGTVTAYTSSESQSGGGVSGQVVEMIGLDVFIEQQVSVAAGVPVSFGLRVKNGLLVGGAEITLYNDIDTYTITIDQLREYDWEEIKIEDFKSTMPWLKVKIQTQSADVFKFTDLRLMYGTTLNTWAQSATEILATNIQFTKLGMQIFDNIHDTETRVTYNEFSTRRRADGAVLFEADDTGVITRDLTVKGTTNYNDSNGVVLKQVTIPKTSALGGVSWIKVL